MDILEEVKQVCEEINTQVEDKCCICYVGDVGNPDTAKNAVKLAAKQFDNNITVLVNNAGIAPKSLNARTDSVQIEEITQDELVRMFTVNTFSMFYFSNAVVPLMKKQKDGAIINIGSVSSFGLTSNAHYSSSKAAVEGFTKTLARELAPYNIRAFLVAPGFVQTDMISDMDQEYLNMVVKFNLTRQMISPWEVANLILYLSHPDAKNLVGQTMHINGGLFLR